MCDFFYKMINRYEELLGGFETKLRKLISEYRLLQAENQLLQRKQSELKAELEQSKTMIMDLKKQNDHLRLLNQLGGQGTDRKAARQQLEKMVREIDQCLALLND